jgi:magnesium chelatase family protein
MLAVISSAALQGIDASPVHVEVNTGERGQPDVLLVGLPDTAVKESRDRVTSALSNSGFNMPFARTSINLAPGSLRKEGPLYDLPIAVGILVATGKLPAESVDGVMFAGELGLSGIMRPVRGALAIARLARALGKRALILPAATAPEAALLGDLPVYGLDSLNEVYRFLAGELWVQPAQPPPLTEVVPVG